MKTVGGDGSAMASSLVSPVLTAPRSPWQDSYAERLIGSIRRECLDHIPCTQRIIAAPDSQIVFLLLPAGAHHLALGKDTPEPQAIQPPELGRVVEIPEVGGLHHRYERRAA